MTKICNILPVTAREQQIVNSLGFNNWNIIEKRDKVLCLDNLPGYLIEKNGHIRWIKCSKILEDL